MAGREWIGVLAACGSSLLGGTAVVATRSVIAATDPATLGMLRYGIGVACLLPLVLLARLPRPRGRDLLSVAGLGILFFTAFPFLFNASLSYTTAARGSLALSTLPFLTLVVGRILGVEAMTPAKLLGVGVALLGVALALSDQIAASTAPKAWLGDLLMVATAACGALYNVLSRPFLRRYPALSYTAFGMLAGAGAMVAVALVGGAPDRALAFDARTWAVVLYLGAVGAALIFFLWSYGLEHTTPARVAITVTLNPVTALILGPALLGEPVSPRLFVGLAAVVAGILLVTWQATAPRARAVGGGGRVG